MSDFLEHHQERSQHPAQQALKREHDSSDDFEFEHLEHELHQTNGQHQQQPQSLLDFSNPLGDFDSRHVGVPAVPPPPPPHLDDLLDMSIPASGNVHELDLEPVPATPPPSAEFGSRRPNFGIEDEIEARLKEQLDDPKAATMAFMETEKNFGLPHDFETKTEDLDFNFGKKSPDDLFKQVSDDEDNTEPTRSEPSSVTPSHIVRPPASDKLDSNLMDDDDMFMKDEIAPVNSAKEPPKTLYDFDKDDFMGEIKSSTLPEPEKSPELDFVKEETTKEMPVKSADQMWNVLEKSSNDRFVEKEMFDEPPTKPLPPLPKGAEQDMFDDFSRDYGNKYEATSDFLSAESKSKSGGGLSGGETGDSEFESEPEPSPAKTTPRPAPPLPVLGDVAERKVYQKPDSKSKVCTENIFKDFSIDAWFNPERLNPKVAALIYWRDPKKSGILFGAVMSVLLSLAYFSLISVVAYISLLTLTCTVAFRIYKTVLQAVQKTSDGHPFKEILDVDLNLPSEKVHEVADIAVANVNAALCELRRLFLVEDIVDSIKFGVLLWSLTYLGSWFNGMTLIIIGVVALFSLPKIYETNKTQIDQHLGVVQVKINEITAKVKAALPIGKKTEATKED